MSTTKIGVKNVSGGVLDFSTLGLPGGTLADNTIATLFDPASLLDSIPIAEVVGNLQLIGYVDSDQAILVLDDVELTKLQSLYVLNVNASARPLGTFASALFMHVVDVIATENGNFTRQEIEDGLLADIYATAGDLPGTAPATIPGFAIVENGTPFPDVYWWQAGGTEWQQSTFNNRYAQPPDPNGEYLIDLSHPPTNPGSGWSIYAMGTFFQITTTLATVVINSVAHLRGTGSAGVQHVWELRKSTVVSPTQPAESTFTTIVASGTFTDTPGAWYEETIPDVPVAENEWYWIGAWVGNGGQFVALASAPKNESYAATRGGSFVSGATTTPPGSIPWPPSFNNSNLYGLSTVRLKDNG